VRCALGAALAIAGLLVAASVAVAASPTDDLRGCVDRVLAVLDAPEMQGPGQATQRFQAARVLALEGLDFNEASRRALGTHWEARTPEERREFVRLFTALIDGAYLMKLSEYNGERLRYENESVMGEQATVMARVLEKSGSVRPIQFWLVHGPDQRWRVWDATFEGMSLVSNYRAQFNRILRSSSFRDLLGRLEERTHK